MLRRASSESWRTSWPATRTVPSLGGGEAGDDAHRRRLPGTVGPQESEDLAAFGLEGDVFDGDEIAEELADVFDFDQERFGPSLQRAPPAQRKAPFSIPFRTTEGRPHSCSGYAGWDGADSPTRRSARPAKSSLLRRDRDGAMVALPFGLAVETQHVDLIVPVPV